MGLNMERIASFIAYWLSAALAAFGAVTPQDFAAYAGVIGVAPTVGANWYYRRQSYALLAQPGQPPPSGQEIGHGLRR